ncbi:MAG: VanZ family protein [Bacteroidota bacterium]
MKLYPRLLNLLLYVVTVLYAVFAIFLHQEVSKLAVGRIPEITGSFIPRKYSVEGGIIFSVVILVLLIRKFRKGSNHLYSLIYLYITLIFIYWYFRVYSLHPVEVIHIVHYSIFVVLLGLTFDRQRKNFFFTEFLLIGFCIGMIDEILQYFVLVPGQKFLDFNDIYVNMIGTTVGLFIFYAFRPIPSVISQKVSLANSKTFLTIAIFLMFLTALVLNGNIQFTTDHVVVASAVEIENGKTVIFLERHPGKLGSYLNHFVKGYFYNLNPYEWLLLTIFTLVVVLSYDPRRFTKNRLLKMIRATAKDKLDTVENDKTT